MPEPDRPSEHTGIIQQVLEREPDLVLDPEDLLAERYKILSIVGRGATGVVVRADDLLTRTVIALKLVKPHLTHTHEWQRVLGGELRHARRLQHANVCRVYDVGEADTASGRLPFLTMEFADGGTFRQSVGAQVPPRSMEQRIDDARAIIAGVAAIHEAGIIHRDIKPENVLRMGDGRLVVSDFGLAVAPGQVTMMSNYSGRAGTPSYMAPEVVMGAMPSPAGDVWSLAVLLHELFFDDRPVFEFLPGKRLLKVPDKANESALTHRLWTFLGTCLLENPADRLGNAMAVRERFEQAVTGEIPRPPEQEGGRRRRFALIGGVALVALGVGAAVAWKGTRKTSSAQVAAPIARPIAVTGVAPNSLANARLLLSRPGGVRCLEALPGGQNFRIIVASTPPEALDVDLATGMARPADLVPDAFFSGCPRLSPDGDKLVYSKSDGKVRSAVMLAGNPQGRDARQLAEGTDPKWFPHGSEILFQIDGRRMGVLSLGATLTELPSPSDRQWMLMAAAANPTGDRVAMLYRGKNTSGLLQTLTYPEGKVVWTSSPEGALRDMRFDGTAGDILIAAMAKGRSGIARVTAAGGFVWDTRDEDRNIVRSLDIGPQRVVVAFSTGKTLSLVDPAGHVQKIGEGVIYGSHLSRTGRVLATANAPDGTRRIVMTLPGQGDLRPVTPGPDDSNPWFTHDDRQFVYVDGHSVRLCEFPQVGLATCRLIHSDKGDPSQAILSPDGTRLAYQSNVGAQVRQKVVVLATGKILDLGVWPQPVRSCAAKWSQEGKLWLHRRDRADEVWDEINIDTGLGTGRRETLAKTATGDCRFLVTSGTPPFALKVTTADRSELFVLQRR